MNQPVRFSALGIIGLFILSANISLAEEATEFRGTTDSKKEEGASESDGNEAATPTNKKETEDADADEKKSVDDSQTPAATTDGDDSTKSPKETVDTPVDNGDSAGETPRASSKEDASSKDEQASDGVAQQKHDASPPPPANDQGILEINTAPHNAKVFIGYSAHRTDQEIGETPFALQLPPGTYYLSLRKEGYIPATAVAKVEAGKTASVQIQLEQEVGHRHRKVRIAGHVCLWTGVVAQ